MIRVRAVGQTSSFAPAMVTSQSMSQMSIERKVTAAGVLLGGLGSALSLYLFATGHQREAFAIGIASALVGAVVGFTRVVSEG